MQNKLLVAPLATHKFFISIFFFFLCKWPPLHSCYSPKNAATLEVTNQRLHWPNAWHAAAVGNCWHTAWKTHSLGGEMRRRTGGKWEEKLRKQAQLEITMYVGKPVEWQAARDSHSVSNSKLPNR